MKLLLIGPPGAGKGTHAKIYCKKFNLINLATGDILRANIRSGTPLGQKAKETIEAGNLVSDELVNQMVFEEIKSFGVDKGYLFDGYPRTLGQAKALDDFLAKEGQKLDAVLDLATSEELIMFRLSGRRICTSDGCKGNFHITNMPSKIEGVCDLCGGKLVQRKDDKPETIKHRLETYEKETMPLLDYYRKQRILHDIDGDLSIPDLQDVTDKLFEELKLVK